MGTQVLETGMHNSVAALRKQHAGGQQQHHVATSQRTQHSPHVVIALVPEPRICCMLRRGQAHRIQVHFREAINACCILRLRHLSGPAVGTHALRPLAVEMKGRTPHKTIRLRKNARQQKRQAWTTRGTPLACASPFYPCSACRRRNADPFET